MPKDSQYICDELKMAVVCREFNYTISIETEFIYLGGRGLSEKIDPVC